MEGFSFCTRRAGQPVTGRQPEAAFGESAKGIEGAGHDMRRDS